MRASSTAELIDAADTPVGNSAARVITNEQPVSEQSAPSSHVRSYDAEAARLAGRMNAARISETEVAGYLAKHAALVQKKYSGDFTFEDERNLKYVRWTLDRIEDAVYGRGLDALEGAVSDYEDFCRRLSSFSADLKAAKGR
jgi:hypothetical protein